MNTVGIGSETQVGRTIIRVAHLLFGWMILAVIAGCSTDDRETGTDPRTNREGVSSVSHIDDIFTLEREIVLTDSIYIANHTYLDIDADDKFLLTDIIGGQAILFDKNGHHKRTLSTEPCDPGFPWQPSQARFKPDGNIIANSSIWGYEFSNNGECIGKLNDEFEFPHSMGFDNKGYIYGFYVYGQQNKGYHIRKMNKRGESIDKFGFDDTYFWYTGRHLSVPDIVVDKNGHVYHAKIFSPHIDKYDEQGDFITQIARKPDYYKELKINDSEFAVDRDIKSASQKAIGKFSITRQLFLLNDETIMIQYHNEYQKNPDKKFGLAFVDLEGNHLFDTLTHIKLISAKDGFAYSFFDSTNTGKGFAVGPPSLKVYRYLPPAQ